MNRWINAHDRLPGEDELVLAAVTGRDENIEWEEAYLLARFYPGEGWMLEEYPEAENFRITWWMKLPDDLPDADVVQTNADRIREMSDEELAKMFTKASADGCPPKMDWDCAKDEYGWDACDDCWCKWLRQQHKED